LLRKEHVRAAVKEKVQGKLTHLDCTADRILLELSRLAFLDTRKLFNDDGTLKPIHTLDDDTAAAIAGLDHDELFQYFGKGQRKNIGTTTKVKLVQKTQALELLGKYRKLFSDTPPQSRDPNAPLNITVTLVAPNQEKVIEQATLSSDIPASTLDHTPAQRAKQRKLLSTKSSMRSTKRKSKRHARHAK
jgi:Terminase small subunit